MSWAGCSLVLIGRSTLVVSLSVMTLLVGWVILSELRLPKACIAVQDRHCCVHPEESRAQPLHVHIPSQVTTMPSAKATGFALSQGVEAM